MRVGGGFPLLTVRLYGGLNNKINSMYQWKMLLDRNPRVYSALKKILREKCLR